MSDTTHVRILYAIIGALGIGLVYAADWQREQDNTVAAQAILIAEQGTKLQEYQLLLEKQKENLELQLKIQQLEAEKQAPPPNPQYQRPWPQQHQQYWR